MSTENVKKFFELAVKDKDLQMEIGNSGIASVMQQNGLDNEKTKEVLNNLVNLSKKYNLPFSTDEYLEFCKNTCKKAGISKQKLVEMSEFELENINGGMAGDNFNDIALGVNSIKKQYGGTTYRTSNEWNEYLINPAKNAGIIGMAGLAGSVAGGVVGMAVGVGIGSLIVLGGIIAESQSKGK